MLYELVADKSRTRAGLSPRLRVESRHCLCAVSGFALQTQSLAVTPDSRPHVPHPVQSAPLTAAATAPGDRWRPPKRRFKNAPRGFVGWTQKGIAGTLSLTFQLDEIDYWRENWWHADLDLEQFERLQKSKGESIFQLAGRIFGRSFKLLLKMVRAGSESGESNWTSIGRLAQALVPMPLVAQLVLYGVTSAATEQPLSRSPVAQAFIKARHGSGRVEAMLRRRRVRSLRMCKRSDWRLSTRR